MFVHTLSLLLLKSLISWNDLLDSSILLSSSSGRERDGGEGLAGGSRGQGNLIHLLQLSRRKRRFSLRDLHHLISLFSLSSYHLPIGFIG